MDMENVLRKVSCLALAMAPLMAFDVAASQDGTAETIYHNAKVVTVNDSFEIAEAVAVKNGHIMAVGSNSQIQELASTETKLVDLHGKTLLPGFYDGHIHVGTRGRSQSL
ncbi:hypothetical protein GCM10022421_34610 [Oceanisphaera sediminis]|uniref:Amidohydrolase 3 domain-containing protein n=1 Tax=Oceanisphaera sediminis TaxID=981381 RepID=A0ABP7ES34_9GAMM